MRLSNAPKWFLTLKQASEIVTTTRDETLRRMFEPHPHDRYITCHPPIASNRYHIAFFSDMARLLLAIEKGSWRVPYFIYDTHNQTFMTASRIFKIEKTTQHPDGGQWFGKEQENAR